MKKTIIIITLLLLSLSFVSALVTNCEDGTYRGSCNAERKYCGSENLIKNSGFEVDLNYDGIPDYFGKIGDSVELNYSVYYEGLASMKIYGTGSSFDQNISISEGTNYTLYAYAYGDCNSAAFYYNHSSRGARNLNTENGFPNWIVHNTNLPWNDTKSWKLLPLTFTAAETMTLKNLRIECADTNYQGNLFIDAMHMSVFLEDGPISTIDNCGVCGCNGDLLCSPDGTCVESLESEFVCLDLNFDYMVNEDDQEYLNECKGEIDQEFFDLCDAAGLIGKDIDALYEEHKDKPTLCSMEVIGELHLRGNFQFIGDMDRNYCPHPNCYATDVKRCIEVDNTYERLNRAVKATCINGEFLYQIAEKACRTEFYCRRENVLATHGYEFITEPIGGFDGPLGIDIFTYPGNTIVEGDLGVCLPHKDVEGKDIEGTGIEINFLLSTSEWNSIIALAQSIPSPFNTTYDNNIKFSVLVPTTGSSRTEYDKRCFGVWLPPAFRCIGEPVRINTCEEPSEDISRMWRMGGIYEKLPEIRKQEPHQEIIREPGFGTGITPAAMGGSGSFIPMGGVVLNSGWSTGTETSDQTTQTTRGWTITPTGSDRAITSNIGWWTPPEEETTPEPALTADESGYLFDPLIEGKKVKAITFKIYPKPYYGKVLGFFSIIGGPSDLGFVQAQISKGRSPPNQWEPNTEGEKPYYEKLPKSEDFREIDLPSNEELAAFDPATDDGVAGRVPILRTDGGFTRYVFQYPTSFEGDSVCLLTNGSAVEGCLAHGFEYTVRARVLDSEGRPTTDWVYETFIADHYYDIIPPYIETLRQIEQDVYACNDFRWTNPDIDPIIMKEGDIGLINDVKWRFKEGQLTVPYYYQLQYTNDLRYWFDVPAGERIDPNDENYVIHEKVFRPNDKSKLWYKINGVEPPPLMPHWNNDAYIFSYVGDVQYRRHRDLMKKYRIMHFGSQNCTISEPEVSYLCTPIPTIPNTGQKITSSNFETIKSMLANNQQHKDKLNSMGLSHLIISPDATLEIYEDSCFGREIPFVDPVAISTSAHDYTSCLPEGPYIYRVRTINEEGHPLSRWSQSDYMFINYSHPSAIATDDSYSDIVKQVIDSRRIATKYADPDVQVQYDPDELDPTKLSWQILAYKLPEKYNLLDEEGNDTGLYVREGCSGVKRGLSYGVAAAIIVVDTFFTAGMISSLSPGWQTLILSVSSVAASVSGGYIATGVGTLVCGNDINCIQGFALIGTALGSGDPTSFSQKFLVREVTQRTSGVLQKLCPFKSGAGAQMCGMAGDVLTQRAAYIVGGPEIQRKPFLQSLEDAAKAKFTMEAGTRTCNFAHLNPNSLAGKHVCNTVGGIVTDNSIRMVKEFRNFHFRKEDWTKFTEAVKKAAYVTKGFGYIVTGMKYLYFIDNLDDIAEAGAEVPGHILSGLDAARDISTAAPAVAVNLIVDKTKFVAGKVAGAFKTSAEKLSGDAEQRAALLDRLKKELKDCSPTLMDRIIKDFEVFNIPLGPDVTQNVGLLNAEVARKMGSFDDAFKEQAKESQEYQNYETIAGITGDGRISSTEFGSIVQFNKDKTSCSRIQKEVDKVMDELTDISVASLDLYIKGVIVPILEDMDQSDETIARITQNLVEPMADAVDPRDSVSRTFKMIKGLPNVFSTYDIKDNTNDVYFALVLIHQDQHLQDYIMCRVHGGQPITRLQTEKNAYAAMWDAIQFIRTDPLYEPFIEIVDAKTGLGQTCSSQRSTGCGNVFYLAKAANTDEMLFDGLIKTDPIYSSSLTHTLGCIDETSLPGFHLAEEVPRLMGEDQEIQLAGEVDSDIFDMIADKASCGAGEGLPLATASVIAITGYSTDNPLTCIISSEDNVQLIVQKILFEMNGRVEISLANFKKIVAALAKKNPGWLDYEQRLIDEFNTQYESVPVTDEPTADTEGDRILLSAITPELLLADQGEAEQMIADKFWEESAVRSSLLDNRLRWSIDTINTITNDLGFDMDIMLAEQYLKRFGTGFNKDKEFSKPVFSLYFASRVDDTFFKDLVTRNYRDYKPGVSALRCYAVSGVPYQPEGSDPVIVDFRILVDGVERASSSNPDCFTVGNGQLYDEYPCQGPSLEQFLTTDDLVKDIRCHAVVNYKDEQQTIERKLDIADLALTGPSLEIIIDTMLKEGNLDERLKAVDLVTPGINMLLDEHMNKLLGYLEDPDLVIPLTYALRQSDAAEDELGRVAADTSNTPELRLRAIETLGNIAPKSSYLQSITDLEPSTIYASEAEDAGAKDENFALVLNEPGPAVTPILVTSEYFLEDIAGGSDVQAIVYESESPGLVKGIIRFDGKSFNLILKRTEDMHYYFIDIPGAENTFYYIPTSKEERPFRFIDARNRERDDNYRTDGIYSFESARQWTDEVTRGKLHFDPAKLASFKEGFNRQHNIELLSYIKNKAGIIPETYRSVAKWLTGLFPDSKYDFGSFGSRIGGKSA